MSEIEEINIVEEIDDEIVSLEDGETDSFAVVEEDVMFIGSGTGVVEEVDPTVPTYVKNIKQSDIQNWNNKADTNDIPTHTSQLINDSGYIDGYTESDPTVPSWAKQPEKPTYKYSEIEELPTIPNVEGLASEKYVDDKAKENKTYIDTKIADLINSAPEALDTLGEVAKAIEENEDIVSALNDAIGKKANIEYVNEKFYGIDLGEIDMAPYDDDIFLFMETLTDEGIYKFSDSIDNFDWYVEVYKLGDWQLGQRYWNTEETFNVQYFRPAIFNSDINAWEWHDWNSYLDHNGSYSVFAQKSQVPKITTTKLQDGSYSISITMGV